MSSSYEKQTKQITQFAYLSGASLKSINNSYTRSDGETVFPNLADANAMVGSMRKSHGRCMRSDRLAGNGIDRVGSKGNIINWYPLKRNFDIHSLLFPKPGILGYELPEWTDEIYESQFGEEGPPDLVQPPTPIRGAAVGGGGPPVQLPRGGVPVLELHPVQLPLDATPRDQVPPIQDPPSPISGSGGVGCAANAHTHMRSNRGGGDGKCRHSSIFVIICPLINNNTHLLLCRHLH